MISLPKSPLDPIAAADWMELAALTSRAKRCSFGSLRGALNAAGLFDGPRAAQLDGYVLQVRAEIEDRRRSAPSSYPFDVVGNHLSSRSLPWQNFSTYLFCLCLSYFGPQGAAVQGHRPERIFEALSVVVASQFVAGKGVRFGAPRHPSELSASFQKAVTELCETYLHEGVSYSGRSRVWQGDEGVDLSAWREHPDGRSGKIVLFGACAAGKRWVEKVYELQVRKWCELWLERPLESPFVSAFFVPHRLPSNDDWGTVAIKAGIPFDRCRISNLVRRLPSDRKHGSGSKWAQEAIRLARV